MVKEISRLFSSQSFRELRGEALRGNEWFTDAFIDTAIDALKREFLDVQKVRNFCEQSGIDSRRCGKRVGVIAAGNIPLVGFGDMFYSLLSGWDVVLKPSSKDPLMKIFAQLDGVEVVESIENFDSIDSVILMGSDATCSLISEKFPTTPTLLRGSMHSVGVLPDRELSDRELEGLYDDIFLYCGRGCRNVSHLILPESYDVRELSSRLSKVKRWELPSVWHDLVSYHRAMSTLRGEEFIDSGSFLLTESEDSHPQPCVLTYRYATEGFRLQTDKIQHIADTSNFGSAQYPTLYDFANGASVPEFLRGILSP